MTASKPVPKYRIGDRAYHAQTSRSGELIGLYWRHKEKWFYCLDYTDEGWGQWIAEDKLVSYTAAVRGG